MLTQYIIPIVLGLLLLGSVGVGSYSLGSSHEKNVCLRDNEIAEQRRTEVQNENTRRATQLTLDLEKLRAAYEKRIGDLTTIIEGRSGDVAKITKELDAAVARAAECRVRSARTADNSAGKRVPEGAGSSANSGGHSATQSSGQSDPISGRAFENLGELAKRADMTNAELQACLIAYRDAQKKVNDFRVEEKIP